jgi:anaerobic magnesium-protoporphyrin IX monomethyl ester cyclase
MKIVLVNLGSRFGPIRAESAWPPLGILYLGTILKDKSHEIHIIDHGVENTSLKKTAQWVLRKNPEIVGLSTLTSSGTVASELSKYLKYQNPDIKIVWGGIHATFNAPNILEKYPFVDYIIRKEGDRAFPQLLDAIEKEDQIRGVNGISFKNDDKIISTPDSTPIRNLDTLPFPDRKLLKLKYISEINGITFSKNFTSILSSRGCPFSCKFCCCSSFADRLWRSRSPENVVEELELLESQGYEQVVFVDDNLTLNEKRMIKICRLIKKRKITIEWFCEGRVDQSSYEMLKWMKRAGCRVIYFGIENAVDRILEYYNKNVTFSHSINAVKKAKKAGLDVIGTYVLGAPTESENEIKRTILSAQKLGIDFPQFNILAATPGMPIWKELMDKGYLKDNDWENQVLVPDVDPDCVPKKRIIEMIKEGYRQFLYRGSFLAGQTYRTIRSSFRLKVLLMNIPNLKNVKKIYERIYE